MDIKNALLMHLATTKQIENNNTQKVRSIEHLTGYNIDDLIKLASCGCVNIDLSKFTGNPVELLGILYRKELLGW